MFDILAETTTGIAVGSGVGVLGLTTVALLVRRTSNKILDHVDDGSIHVRTNNGYVNKELCQERYETIEKERVEHRASINTIHRRIDKVIELQEGGVDKILAAINKHDTT